MDKKISAFEKDDLYQTLDRTNLWIENCDTKTSIVIGTMGVVFALLLSKDYAVKLKEIISHMISHINVFSFLYLVVIAISISMIGVGCYCLFRVLVPKTDTNMYKEIGIQSDSSIFFSTVASSKSYKDYKGKIERSSEDSLKNDLISQIYICSKICNQKFKSYKTGITLVALGFTFFVCLLIIGLITV